MAGLPGSYIYFIKNGELKLIPHFQNIEEEIPENYAEVYNKKTGSLTSNDVDIKIFIIRKDGHKIKIFHSWNYGNNPKILKENVEKYITDELTSGQRTLSEYRKRKLSKPKIKKCRCKK